MKYFHADLGTLNAGATVTVELTGNACNVALVDTANLARYRRGDSFRHVGGHYRRPRWCCASRGMAASGTSSRTSVAEPVGSAHESASGHDRPESAHPVTVFIP